MHVAIQVVYCHYILTPFMECLWYVKFWHFCLKQGDKSIERKTKGQAMALRINVLQYNRFMILVDVAKSLYIWEETGLLQQAGRQNAGGSRKF